MPAGPVQAEPAGPLGTRWEESESGWNGVWIRRGETNTFDATWTQGGSTVNATLTITINGNQVSVNRPNASDGNNCTYTGTLDASGTNVTGTYSCTRYPGPYPWSARIIGATPPASPPAAPAPAPPTTPPDGRDTQAPILPSPADAASTKISDAVQVLLADIQAKSEGVGQSGGMSPEEFQAYLLDQQTRLDLVRTMLDAIEGEIRSFQRP